MQSVKTKKLAIAAIFVALAVVGSAFIQFPVFGSQCSPTQHMVNVLCAVFLGPGWGVGVAFGASFKDQADSRAHQANEFLDLRRFKLHAEICLEAMYRMLTAE